MSALQKIALDNKKAQQEVAIQQLGVEQDSEITSESTQAARRPSAKAVRRPSTEAAQEVANTTETSNSLELESAQQPEPLTLTVSQRQQYDILKEKINTLFTYSNNEKNQEKNDIKNNIREINLIFNSIKNENIENKLDIIINKIKVTNTLCKKQKLSHAYKQLCEIKELLQNFKQLFQ
jgi:hypothetical protein